MKRRSLAEFVDEFHARGTETAFVYRRGYRTVCKTYGEIAEAARQFARELEVRQISRGDRVLIWGENCAEWVIAFWGCVLCGAVAVPMDAIAAPGFSERVAGQVGAKLLVCSRDVAWPTLSLPAILFDSFDEVLSRHQSSCAPPELRRGDTLEIVFTSGTTSEPRGVVISHGNVLANLETLEDEIRKYRKIERIFHPIRFLNLVPLSHVFGQFMGMFVPPLLGATVNFLDSLIPAEITRCIKSRRIAALVAVPRMIEGLKEKVERDFENAGRLEEFRRRLQNSDDVHFLRRWWRFRKVRRQFGLKFFAFICGGAALDQEIEVFWRRLGFPVIQGYGMTETTSLVSVNHPFQVGKGSIGKLLPGVEMKLAPDGEILVRGANIASRYWQGESRSELSKAGTGDDWFHTGDLGELDERGNLYFKGRKKYVIVTAEGMNVYPGDLEAALRRQPEIRDCVVVGAARGGNAEPFAVLILRDSDANAETAVKRANDLLAEFQRIRHWLIWPEDDFPRTSTQKPRAQIVQQFVEAKLGGASGSSGQLPGDDGTIAGLIGGITGRMPGNLPLDASLTTDLNLSSIDRVDLLSALEDRYQVEIDESKFGAATTVGDLENLVRRPSASHGKYRYPRWAQRWPITWIRLAVYYLLSWPATLLLGYPRIVGRENLQGVRGPLLIVSNHITSIDIGLIMAALPARLRNRVAVAMLGERLRAMRHPTAKDGVLSRMLDKIDYALVVALFNAFPLPQQTGFRGSFAFAGESVDRGYSVVVFPEGRRTTTGKMAHFRAGIGILAQRLDLPVLPIKIDGLFELKKARKHVTRPYTVTVTIGKLIEIDRSAGPEAIARDLEQRVKALPGHQ